MTFGDFFSQYWWLIFPLFGMAMAFQGMNHSERRTRSMVDLIRAYADQGKEPPPELLRLAQKGMQDEDSSDSGSSKNSGAWTFVVFAGVAAGFSVGWWVSRDQDYAFAFLIIAVTMGVMALGALLILIFGRK